MKLTPQDGRYPLDTRFDASLANQLAHLEIYNKHYYRPNTYLHKWWARRCGTTFRLILKHLVTDPDLQDYYQPGGLEGQLILDPMMGGGTTLHEALRLGANVVGMDLDPIPFLQARATLTQLPLDALEEAFAHMMGLLRRELAPFFVTTCPHCHDKTENWYVLYGAQRSCNCRQVIMVDSLVLRQEADGSFLRLCPDCHQVIAGTAPCDCRDLKSTPIVERDSICNHCQGIYQEDLQLPFYARYTPLVVSGHCREHGLFLRSFDETAQIALQKADDRRNALSFQAADYAVEPGQKSIQLLRRGIYSYLDLFSSRQLLVLERIIANLSRYEPLVRLNLALLTSTSLEFNAMLCGYKGKNKRRSGAIRHTFAHHAYAFPYTALENNPLYPRKASGTLQKLFHARIRRGRLWANLPLERDLSGPKAKFVPIPGEIDAGLEVPDDKALDQGRRRFRLHQGTATTIPMAGGSVDAIVTDPPYFDSVQYSDLSAFFRVWLRALLPEAADWEFDVNDSAVDPHNNDAASRYAELLGQIFLECRRVLREPHGRLIFTFHHWNPKAWAALTAALKQAGFFLLNQAVVLSENPISVHIAKMNALTHDAILVLAPGSADQRRQWPRPETINSNKSELFCADCAALVGWMLESDLTPAQLQTEWQTALSFTVD